MLERSEVNIYGDRYKKPNWYTSKLHHNQAMILENPQPKHVSHQSKEFEHIYQHRTSEMQKQYYNCRAARNAFFKMQLEMLNIQLSA